MNHYLVTKFNVKVKQWEKTKNEQLVLSKEWLEQRFKLFENYCLPSVKNQINQNFYWCVFFDINTSNYYKSKIEKIAKNFINFKPIYIDNYTNLENELITFIKNTNSNKDSFYITTRLDNDDMIHQDFIDTIQSLFREQKHTIIDLRTGYQLILNKNKFRIRQYNNNLNPFISLIKHIDEPGTIWDRTHHEWGRGSNIIISKDRRLWVEIVHDKNLINDEKYKLKRIKKLNGAYFGVSKNQKIFDESNLIFISNIPYFFIKIINFYKKIIINILLKTLQKIR